MYCKNKNKTKTDLLFKPFFNFHNALCGFHGKVCGSFPLFADTVHVPLKLNFVKFWQPINFVLILKGYRWRKMDSNH